MDKIPMEWVDKIFHCMTEFYGERWTKNFKTAHSENYYKSVWQNGLMGLTYEQIKSAIIFCKRSSQEPYNLPPHIMEFYLYAKGDIRPPINYSYKKVTQSSREVATQNISKIRTMIGGPPPNVDREKRSFL